jgi:hypothetical protein
MRRTIFALTVIFLAPTTVMAATSDRIAPAGVAEIDQRGSLEGNVILAKGKQDGTGPGAGGQKGKKQGGHKGKQKEGKDNKDKS